MTPDLVRFVQQLQQWPQSGALAPSGETPPAPAGETPPAATPPAGEVPPAPPVGEGGGTGGGPVPPVPAAPAPARDWREDRLAELTGKRREAEERAAAAELRLQQLEAAAAAGQTPDVQAHIQAEARKLATQQTAEQTFREAATKVAETGKGQFPDWDSRINSLAQLLDKTDQESIGRYTRMVQTAIKVGDAHEVLHRLGGDLNEANRILRLDPVEQALALKELRPAGAGTPSGAPKPPRPVAGGGNHAPEVAADDPEAADKLPTSEWMRRRNAQVRGGRAA